ncbi:MAG: diguanylate cyclase [Lachnospiraceae bacterium]|nr:diguanylate cyclase [Lachnospiraceae bacterium]
MKKDLQKKIFLSGRFYYCLLVVFFVSFVLIASLITGHKSGFLVPGDAGYEDGWKYEDGSDVSFEDLMKEDRVVITKVTNGDVINNKSLCFQTKNIFFTVYMDDEVIYSFHPKPPAVFGKSYGTFPHTVTLPVLAEDGILKIEAENIYPKTQGFIRDVSLANGMYFIVSEMQRSASEFMISLIIFSFGIVFFFIGVFGRYYGDKRYEIMSMGVFAMVASLWIATESTLFSLLTGLPIAIHFIDYMMLAMLPVPMVLFASYITENKESKVPIVIGAAATLNIIISVMLSSMEVKDYHELLMVSHVILLLAVIAVLYLFIRSIAEKKLRKGVIIVLAITFGLPVIIGAAELIRYRVNPEEYVGKPYLQYILFFFIFLCSFYEFISLSELSKKSQYAEIMEQIAYTDALTGLLNREAFNDEIESQKDERVVYTIVALDMNHLKKVNDRLGHLIGDEYIKKLAQFIKDSFEKGKCFRMGGDEFLILTEKKMSDSDFQNSLAVLNRKIEAYNNETKREIPLSVAIGYAAYDSSKCKMEDVIRQADEHMYEQKKKMKMEVY